MILSIMRTAFWNLRRDRGALTLAFVVPIAFFSIFAVIFGSRNNAGTDPVRVLLVDDDKSNYSRRFAETLQAEKGLRVRTAPETEKGRTPAPYDSVSAEAAVKAGDAPVALIIPKGFGAHPFAFGPSEQRPKMRILHDSSDPIAPQIVYGLLQKSAMTAMPDGMAEEGVKYFDQVSGGLTKEQRTLVDESLRAMRERLDARKRAAAQGSTGDSTAAADDAMTGLVAAEMRDVVGETKKNPLVAFYAAGIGVMFLLFSASSSGGALLEEAESGTLDRVLSTRVTMTTLLLGKLAYASLLGLVELTVMFVWGAIAFHLELASHLAGFVVMASVSSVAASGLGLLLAASCRTRQQLSALTTLVVLTMSAMGGSMFPRFLMPAFMQKVGLLTFNAWALDGFTKIFWRDEPVWSVWPQVAVLLAAAAMFFLIARRLASRWDVT